MAGMPILNFAVEALSNEGLLNATRELVREARGVEAELLVHLGEIDERKLYLEGPFPSMFAFCCDELGFSEDAAYSRILVARAGRRLPEVIEALRSGGVHLAGLRLLVPHLTTENHRQVLAQAGGKSKREIEELVACLAPRPPVASLIRRVPEPLVARESFMTAAPPPLETGASPAFAAATAPSREIATTERVQTAGGRPVIAPLSAETFKIQFTAGRSFRDKLRQAQDLLRHRVPDGNMSTILEMALDVLLEHVRKERFATGRKGHKRKEGACASSSRHIPDAIKRAVHARDGGRCTFTDEQGRRCPETGMLEFDHVDGFARTGLHEVDGLRLLCRSHNQYAAEQMYGRAFMEEARANHKRRQLVPGQVVNRTVSQRETRERCDPLRMCRSQVQGQAVPRHLPEACCAVQGQCGGLRAHHFEVEGAQAATARFFEDVGENCARHPRPPGFGNDIQLLDPERLASLLDRDDLIREQHPDGLAVALGEQQPGRGSGPEGRVESTIDPIRLGGEVVLDQLRREQGVHDRAVRGFGVSDAEGHRREPIQDAGTAPGRYCAMLATRPGASSSSQ
jgi:hypothetical protein